MTKDEALKALIHEMEYVLSCINEEKIPFDGDDFHEALRLGKKALAQPEQTNIERHEANVQKFLGEPQPEQEPVAWQVEVFIQGVWSPMGNPQRDKDRAERLANNPAIPKECQRIIELYTTPPQRKPLADEEIQEVVTKAVRERRLSWLGFKQDDQGTYNIPVLSPADYQFARAIEAAHGIKE